MQAPSKRITPRRPASAKVEPAAIASTPITWSDGASRAVAMRAWRNAACRAVAGKARALAVAWALEWLVAKDGRATATDPHLAAESGVPRQHVAGALDALEVAGLIARRPLPGRRREITPTLPDSHQIGTGNRHCFGGDSRHQFGGANTASNTAPPPSGSDPWVTAEARRLNRATAMARRQLEEAVLAGDDEGEARAKARLLKAHGVEGGDQP